MGSFSARRQASAISCASDIGISVLQQNDELIAAKTGRGRANAPRRDLRRRLRKFCRHIFQNRIADEVTEGIVDAFEAVQMRKMAATLLIR